MKYEFAEYNVTILGSKFPYGFEYLSEHASLLISPLTERCFLTLSLAMDQYSCGTAIGVNGSGKTETIKELAKVELFFVLLPCHALVTEAYRGKEPNPQPYSYKILNPI